MRKSYAIIMVLLLQFISLLCYNDGVVHVGGKTEQNGELFMLDKILKQYGIEEKILNVETNSSGNINNTFVVEVASENGARRKYTVQKINTSVFSSPEKLMSNIENVCKFLKEQQKKEKNSPHTVLELLKTKNNQPFCVIENCGKKEFYRIYNFIENSVVYNNLSDPKIAYNTGKAFGNFQRLLRDYPIESLHETIKDFHNTAKRFDVFEKDCKADVSRRGGGICREINFIRERKDVCSMITKLLGSQQVPLRVTHNDTKVNNVVMSQATGDFLAVIDFDTIMPGSLLFDYGDGIRSSTSTAAEDETDLAKVGLDLNLFKAYTDGFLSEMAPFITTTELSLMAQSVRVITLELGMRFLNDYINGDTYFKIKYPAHNLDRARNQLKLVEDVEKKMDFMQSYIQKSYQNSLKEQSLTMQSEKTK